MTNPAELINNVVVSVVRSNGKIHALGFKLFDDEIGKTEPEKVKSSLKWLNHITEMKLKEEGWLE